MEVHIDLLAGTKTCKGECAIQDRRNDGTEYSNGVLRTRRANGLIDHHSYLPHSLSAWTMTSLTFAF